MQYLVSTSSLPINHDIRQMNVYNAPSLIGLFVTIRPHYNEHVRYPRMNREGEKRKKEKKQHQ